MLCERTQQTAISNLFGGDPTTGAGRMVRMVGWRRGVEVSGVRRMNEVNERRARLLPGWVTVFFGRVYHLGM